MCMCLCVYVCLCACLCSVHMCTCKVGIMFLREVGEAPHYTRSAYGDFSHHTLLKFSP